MTDIVNKVARALCSSTPGPACVILDGCECRNEARAAILAVLEWYSEAYAISEQAATAGFDQLPVSELITDVDVYDCVAAAMKAELNRMKEGGK